MGKLVVISALVFEHQTSSASLIQRAFRIHYAKRLVKTARILSSRRRLQQKYVDERNVVAFYYEQHGAAHRIQRWFLSLRWYKHQQRDRQLSKWIHRHARVALPTVKPSTKRNGVAKMIKDHSCSRLSKTPDIMVSSKYHAGLSKMTQTLIVAHECVKSQNAILNPRRSFQSGFQGMKKIKNWVLIACMIAIFLSDDCIWKSSRRSTQH